jgi:hypothetical protein
MQWGRVVVSDDEFGLQYRKQEVGKISHERLHLNSSQSGPGT